MLKSHSGDRPKLRHCPSSASQCFSAPLEMILALYSFNRGFLDNHSNFIPKATLIKVSLTKVNLKSRCP